MTTSISLLTKALQELHIDYSIIDSHNNFVQLNFPKQKHYIINSTLGLISNSERIIAIDKGYQYLLLKEAIPMPRTKIYLDPLSKYSQYAELKSNKEIIKDTYKNFTFPFILKKNQGSEGINVFKVNNTKELEEKLKTIFNQKSSSYDHVCLAQDYIKSQKEFRIVTYNKKIFLAYWKNTTNATFADNLSPLHWKNAKATSIGTTEMKELSIFVKKIFSQWPIKYAGFDIVKDINGKLWLIEINGSPVLTHFVRDNGEQKVLKMYKEILNDLKNLNS